MVPGQLLGVGLMHIDVEVVYTDGRTSPTHVNSHFNQISAQAATLLEAAVSRNILLASNHSTLFTILCESYYLLRHLSYPISIV
jgi:hypothetical protein